MDLEPCGADFSLPWSNKFDPTTNQNSVFMERSVSAVASHEARAYFNCTEPDTLTLTWLKPASSGTGAASSATDLRLAAIM